jgi:hypothetical protein
MTWGAVAGMAVGAVSKYIGDKKAKRAEKRGMDTQKENIALQREGLDFSKEQYGDWQEKYDPVFDDMMSEIDSGITPDYSAIAGDVNSSFESAQDQERRQMQRYGVKPTDGAARQSEREYGIAKSTAHSGIRNKARQDSAGIKFNRLAGIAGGLQGVGVNLGGQVGNSYGRAGNAITGLANAQFDQADARYQRSADDAAGWGTAIGGVDWSGAWNAVKGWGSGSGSTPSRGGTFPVGSRPSDERLKENVKLVGVAGGINLYTWDWNDLAVLLGVDDPTFGVMAQEHMDSEFVFKGSDGYLCVNYEGLFGRRIH